MGLLLPALVSEDLALLLGSALSTFGSRDSTCFLVDPEFLFVSPWTVVCRAMPFGPFWIFSWSSLGGRPGLRAVLDIWEEEPNTGYLAGVMTYIWISRWLPLDLAGEDILWWTLQRYRY